MSEVVTSILVSQSGMGWADYIDLDTPLRTTYVAGNDSFEEPGFKVGWIVLVTVNLYLTLRQKERGATVCRF